MSAPVFDTERIVRLRLSQGYSQRALGRAARLSETAISRLESPEGSTHIELAIKDLLRLAEALGVEPAALFRATAVGNDEEGAAQGESEDDRRLEALLASLSRPASRDELARALDWLMPRLDRAIRDLAARLEKSGQRLQTQPRLALRPLEALLDDGQVKAAERAALSRVGLTVSAAGMLRRVMTSKGDSRLEASARGQRRTDLGRLFNLGAAIKRGGSVVLTDETAYSLGLKDWVEESASAELP